MDLYRKGMDWVEESFYVLYIMEGIFVLAPMALPSGLRNRRSVIRGRALNGSILTVLVSLVLN